MYYLLEMVICIFYCIQTGKRNIDFYSASKMSKDSACEINFKMYTLKE